MTEQSTGAILDRANRHAQAFLAGLRERHVGERATPAQLRAALGGELPLEGEAPGAVLDLLARGVDGGLMASAGPRYFGFVIGGSHPVAVAADWLTAAWDQNCGLYATSPAAAVVEEVAAGWLLNLFGLPSGASVGFVTGGQMANFTCLAAARHAVLDRAGWDVEENGLAGAPPVQVFISAEAHVTVLAALAMLGLGRRPAHIVSVDSQGRMRPAALEPLLAAHRGPAIVVAQAGHVNSGAIDPIGPLVDLTHRYGGWLHVDGAFGLWAAASPARRHLVAGIEAADSWSVDAHKWLNVPYDSGVAIVADPGAHLACMGATASYLKQAEGDIRDPLMFTPELSRRGRGFPIYAVLRALGRRGVANLVDRLCERARQMAGLLGSAPGVQALNEVVLNQVLVGFAPPPGVEAAPFVRGVIERVQREGTCWLSGTDWQGMPAMRVSVSNWSTGPEDIERSADSILRAYNDQIAADSR
jgi:glutamate/tyrosine decarboxylase-like PLP-dependent enzyme